MDYHNIIYLPGARPKPPTIVVKRLRRPGGDLLLIERCVFCGGRHTHGAANRPCGLTHHRLVHCVRPPPEAAAGYFLYEPCEEPEPPPPARKPKRPPKRRLTPRVARKREAEFDERIAVVLHGLLAVAWRYDYTTFLEALRLLNASPHRRRELTELFRTMR
jgi:hypothetical protein